MRIAVDVMGGDHGCKVVVSGVKLALESSERIQSLLLVGQQSVVEAALEECGCTDSRVQIVHASEVLTMEDKPVAAVRRKKDSSLVRSIELVKEGRADAVISPGNTGGLVAASTLKLRTLPGVDRPGIATVIPAPENEFVLLDSGANIDCKPRHLLEYAIMGNVYSREILGVNSPRVGILSVGTEAIKGNELTLEAYKLCQKAPLNFIGNVEGHDLFNNRVDVVVCDGFVGNIVLKTCESLARGMLLWLKSELKANLKRKVGALLAQNAFRTIARRMDPDGYGGAPLLGLNGHVMKAHGSARERAIMNALLLTAESIRHNVNQHIIDEIAAAQKSLGSDPQPDGSPTPA
ncbi:MAG: phosphate acyltransferase PlsX [Limisphaerales bacterium]|jgi:glycerol-3-phosphate acyltransferase PlsX